MSRLQSHQTTRSSWHAGSNRARRCWPRVRRPKCRSRLSEIEAASRRAAQDLTTASAAPAQCWSTASTCFLALSFVMNDASVNAIFGHSKGAPSTRREKQLARTLWVLGIVQERLGPPRSLPTLLPRRLNVRCHSFLYKSGPTDFGPIAAGRQRASLQSK